MVMIMRRRGKIWLVEERRKDWKERIIFRLQCDLGL
jgi:hypothetical protein